MGIWPKLAKLRLQQVNRQLSRTLFLHTVCLFALCVFLQVYIGRSDGHKFICTSSSISCGFRHIRFEVSSNNNKGNEIFAEVNN